MELGWAGAGGGTGAGALLGSVAGKAIGRESVAAADGLPGETGAGDRGSSAAWTGSSAASSVARLQVRMILKTIFIFRKLEILDSTLAVNSPSPLPTTCANSLRFPPRCSGPIRA